MKLFIGLAVCLLIISAVRGEEEEVSNKDNTEMEPLADGEEKKDGSVPLDNSLLTDDDVMRADFMEKYLPDKEKLMEDNFNKEYLGCEYIYHPHRVTFYEGENICKTLGGHVAYKNMLTPYDRKQVFKLFGKVSTWIGVRYAFGKWRTQNMKVVNHGSFGWSKGEPNFINREHCTENWYSTPYVNNINCQLKSGVICEINCSK